jgi:hypothetical protein
MYLCQVRKTLTDGNSSVMKAVANAIEAKQLGGKQGLCFYHLFWQHFKRLVSAAFHLILLPI